MSSLLPPIHLQSPLKRSPNSKIAIVKPFLSRKVISPIKLTQPRRSHPATWLASHPSPLSTTNAILRRSRKRECPIQETEDEWDSEDEFGNSLKGAQSDVATVGDESDFEDVVFLKAHAKVFSRGFGKIRVLAKPPSKKPPPLTAVPETHLSSPIRSTRAPPLPTSPPPSFSSSSPRSFLVHSTPNTSSIASTCSPNTPWSARDPTDISLDSISFVYDPSSVSDEFLRGPVVLSPFAKPFVYPVGPEVNRRSNNGRARALQFPEHRSTLADLKDTPIKQDLLRSIAPLEPTSLQRAFEQVQATSIKAGRDVSATSSIPQPMVEERKVKRVQREGEKSIPVMVGPESLPYARNPSGVDGSVLDSDGRLNIWQPSVNDPEPEHLDYLHFQRRPGAPNPTCRVLGAENDVNSPYAHPSKFRVYTIQDMAAMSRSYPPPLDPHSSLLAKATRQPPVVSNTPVQVASPPLQAYSDPARQSLHQHPSFQVIYPPPVQPQRHSQVPVRPTALPTADHFLRAQMNVFPDPIGIGQDILHLTASLLSLGLDPAVVLRHTAKHMAAHPSLTTPSGYTPLSSRRNSPVPPPFSQLAPQANFPSNTGPRPDIQQSYPSALQAPRSNETPAHPGRHFHAPYMPLSANEGLLVGQSSLLDACDADEKLKVSPAEPRASTMINVEAIQSYSQTQSRIPTPYPMGEFVMAPPQPARWPSSPESTTLPTPMELPVEAWEAIVERPVQPPIGFPSPGPKQRTMTSTGSTTFLPAGIGAGFKRERTPGPWTAAPRTLEEKALEAIEFACAEEQSMESSMIQKERSTLVRAVEASKKFARLEEEQRSGVDREVEAEARPILETVEPAAFRPRKEKEDRRPRKPLKGKVVPVKRVFSLSKDELWKSTKEVFLTLGSLNEMFAMPSLGESTPGFSHDQPRKIVSEPVLKKAASPAHNLPPKPAAASPPPSAINSRLPVRSKMSPSPKSVRRSKGDPERSAACLTPSPSARKDKKSRLAKPFCKPLGTQPMTPQS